MAEIRGETINGERHVVTSLETWSTFYVRVNLELFNRSSSCAPQLWGYINYYRYCKGEGGGK